MLATWQPGDVQARSPGFLPNASYHLTSRLGLTVSPRFMFWKLGPQWDKVGRFGRCQGHAGLRSL
jgi:hypothetical protein